MTDDANVTISDSAPPKYRQTGIDRLFGPFLLGMIVQIGGTILAMVQWPGSSDSGAKTGNEALADLGLIIASVGGIVVLVFIIAMGVVLGMRARAAEL